MTVAIPYLVNPDQANARGKIGFFFGGLAAIALVWSYFRVPETKGECCPGVLDGLQMPWGTNHDFCVRSNV